MLDALVFYIGILVFSFNMDIGCSNTPLIKKFIEVFDSFDYTECLKGYKSSFVRDLFNHENHLGLRFFTLELLFSCHYTNF